MSFQDLRRAGGQGDPRSGGPANGMGPSTSDSSFNPKVPNSKANPSPSQGVASGVFQMNTAVNTFNRLVNSLGTAKDTPELRERLHKSRQYIGQLAKETSAKLKDVTVGDHSEGVSTTKKIGDAKLAKDFQSVLKEFERAQRTAAEREAIFSATSQQRTSTAGSRVYASGDVTRVELQEQSKPFLSDRQRQEMLVVENELVYNEAVIEEREAGIHEIQQQIAEVSEIFQDLAVLVKEQGGMIDDIEANIEATRSQTVQANKQLKKAATSQKESNSFTCWVMAVFAIGLFIFFLVMAT